MPPTKNPGQIARTAYDLHLLPETSGIANDCDENPPSGKPEHLPASVPKKKVQVHSPSWAAASHLAKKVQVHSPSSEAPAAKTKNGSLAAKEKACPWEVLGCGTVASRRRELRSVEATWLKGAPSRDWRREGVAWFFFTMCQKWLRSWEGLVLCDVYSCSGVGVGWGVNYSN